MVKEVLDADLWNSVLHNDSQAFEQIVARHQSAVSAVSFSCLGDFAASEDVAQETFLVAWQTREKLENSSRLRAWLCGIARNLSRNHLRRTANQLTHAEQHAKQYAQKDCQNEVESRAMAAEEQALVWNALESISPIYRDPLVLYYREGRSVAAIAQALDISEDAAKQRLSRGRGLLRDSVASLVGASLEKTRPGKAFTAAVMAAVGTSSLTGQAMGSTAISGSAIAAKAAAKLTATNLTATKLTGTIGWGASGGLLGGLFGAGAGLAGAWLGTWLPAQLAPTVKERELLQMHGRRMLLMSFAFTVVWMIASFSFALHRGWMFAVPIMVLSGIVFTVYVIANSLRVNKLVKKLRAGDNADELPNESSLRRLSQKYQQDLVGRSYRSQATLFGIPLIDIQLADPVQGIANDKPIPKSAFGWIALGDRATGLLFAYGNVAKGLIAMGGLSVGLISFGGCAIGGVAIGGLGLGLIGIGGVGVGILSIGGLAMGWQATGGMALGWQCAAGGGALAYESATGGYALAKHFVVGPSGGAEHFNDEMAKSFLSVQPAPQALYWFMKNQALFIAMTVIISVAPGLLHMALYQRRRIQSAVGGD